MRKLLGIIITMIGIFVVLTIFGCSIGVPDLAIQIFKMGYLFAKSFVQMLFGFAEALFGM